MVKFKKNIGPDTFPIPFSINSFKKLVSLILLFNLLLNNFDYKCRCCYMLARIKFFDYDYC